MSAPKAPGRASTRAIDAWANRNRLMGSTGIFARQLVLVFEAAQLSGVWRRPRVLAVVATGTNASYQYRLQYELVLLAWIFGSFSSNAMTRKSCYQWWNITYLTRCFCKFKFWIILHTTDQSGIRSLTIFGRWDCSNYRDSLSKPLSTEIEPTFHEKAPQSFATTIKLW